MTTLRESGYSISAFNANNKNEVEAFDWAAPKNLLELQQTFQQVQADYPDCDVVCDQLTDDEWIQIYPEIEITIRADDENNAEAFWAKFTESYPGVAEQVRESEAVVDLPTWKAIQQLEGFSDGPEYAKDALVVVE
jgi:hypothetical protein